MFVYVLVLSLFIFISANSRHRVQNGHMYRERTRRSTDAVSHDTPSFQVVPLGTVVVFSKNESSLACQTNKLRF